MSVLLGILSIILLSAPPASAQYTDADADVFAGQPVRVTLPAATDTLIATYRPSTSIARVDTLVGVEEWTPSEAGVVALSTPGGETQNVSARFRKTPISGLFVLLAAGLILFGGAGYALRKLFEDDTQPAV